MPEIIVRPAMEEDIPALSALMNELGYPTTQSEMLERFGVLRQQPDYKTFIAAKASKVLGVAGVMKIYYWEQNGHYLRVQALVVCASARRLGVGRRLMEAVEDWGRESGAVLISLNCGHKAARIAAHQFYPQVGFEHTSAGYTKWLED